MNYLIRPFWRITCRQVCSLHTGLCKSLQQGKPNPGNAHPATRCRTKQAPVGFLLARLAAGLSPILDYPYIGIIPGLRPLALALRALP